MHRRPCNIASGRIVAPRPARAPQNLSIRLMVGCVRKGLPPESLRNWVEQTEIDSGPQRGDNERGAEAHRRQCIPWLPDGLPASTNARQMYNGPGPQRRKRLQPERGFTENGTGQAASAHGRSFPGSQRCSRDGQGTRWLPM